MQATCKPRKARIESVTFGLMSAEDVRRTSAVEVSMSALYKCGVVQKKGANDSSLGTVNLSMLCSTCGNEMDACPGHTGHIVLASPVINVEFLTHVHKILTCVCFFCSRLLVTPSHPKYDEITLINNKKRRQAELYALCQKKHVCCEDDGGCGGVQPVYTRAEVFVKAVFDTLPDTVDRPKVPPAKILQILRHIPEDHIRLLGMDPDLAHPSSMIWTNLIVPPVPMRPARSKANTSSICGEDDLTVRIRSIVRANEAHAEALCSTDPALNTPVDFGSRALDPPAPQLKRAQWVKSVQGTYQDLQRAVAAYQDNKFHTKSGDGSEYGCDRKGIRDRFTGQKAKKGRLRNTIFGKRQNYSARTVITPCSHIDVDQIGVPRWICMKVTYPEHVNAYNIYRLTQMVRNGPDVHPGANYLVDLEQNLTSLGKVDRSQIRLEYGMVVRRHLCDGDDVLFNRQPSLHKFSLMAHRVRVMPGNSFRLHMGATKPYNGDFDGDEMNVQVLLDEKTRAEAREIMSVRRNMVKDGVPLVSFQQHAVAAAYLLTAPDVVFGRAEAMQLLFQNRYFDPARFPAGAGTLTGREVLSLCLPRGLYLDAHGLRVVDGELVEGRVTKKGLNRGLLYTIWKDVGPDAAADFLSGTQLMLETYLTSSGLTLCADDCEVRLPGTVAAQSRAAEAYAASFPGHDPGSAGKRAKATEDNVCLVVDKLRDIVGDLVLDDFSSKLPGRKNGLYEIIRSGAKGNDTNAIQIAGMVGQQRNHQSTRMVGTTSHFRSGHAPALAHGLVTSSFFAGLGSCEYFSHLRASRVGLVDTAVKTSETGYSQRRLAKAMEDVVVRADRTVRDARGDIVQFTYGDDGFDSASIERDKVRLTSLTVDELLLKYRRVPDPDDPRLPPSGWDASTYGATWRQELLHLLELRKRVLDVMVDRQVGSTCLCPVNFERVRLRADALSEKEKGEGPVRYPTPADVRAKVCALWESLVPRVLAPTVKVEAMFWDHCSTSALWGELAPRALEWFLDEVYRTFLRNAVSPHESVGMVASQSCAEPLMQLTLNTFHIVGMASRLVSGVARMKEIVNAVSKPKTPFMTVCLTKGVSAVETGRKMVVVEASRLVRGWSGEYPSAAAAERARGFRRCWRRWADRAEACPLMHLVMTLDKAACVQAGVVPRTLVRALCANAWFKKQADLPALFAHADCRDPGEWWVSVTFAETDTIWQSALATVGKIASGAGVDPNLALLYIYEKLMVGCVVSGVPGVTDFFVTEKKFVEVAGDRSVEVVREVVCTQGSNLLRTLAIPGVDVAHTVTNHIREVESVFGVDAACAAIEREWSSVMELNDAHVCARHIKLIAETMCYRGFVCPMTYAGICHEDDSVVKKASFEKVMDSFIRGATQGHKDQLNGSMEQVCWNGLLRAGTGCVTVFDEGEPVPRQLKPPEGYVPPRFTPPPLRELKRRARPVELPAPKKRRHVEIQAPQVVAVTPVSGKLKRARFDEPQEVVKVYFTEPGGLFVPSSP